MSFAQDAEMQHLARLQLDYITELLSQNPEEDELPEFIQDLILTRPYLELVAAGAAVFNEEAVNARIDMIASLTSMSMTMLVLLRRLPGSWRLFTQTVARSQRSRKLLLLSSPKRMWVTSLKPGHRVPVSQSLRERQSMAPLKRTQLPAMSKVSALRLHPKHQRPTSTTMRLMRASFLLMTIPLLPALSRLLSEMFPLLRALSLRSGKRAKVAMSHLMSPVASPTLSSLRPSFRCRPLRLSLSPPREQFRLPMMNALSLPSHSALLHPSPVTTHLHLQSVSTRRAMLSSASNVVTTVMRMSSHAPAAIIIVLIVSTTWSRLQSMGLLPSLLCVAKLQSLLTSTLLSSMRRCCTISCGRNLGHLMSVNRVTSRFPLPILSLLFHLLRLPRLLR
ncbi:hypothetical protein LB505_008859 [Fusarium chuoi]|nr:hypothetical protein LB505_008859 [Fusarium chuoi]